MHKKSEGLGRLMPIVVISILVAGVCYVLSHSDAGKAVDETVEVFVPGPEGLERRMGYIEEARQLTDLINSRQAQALDELE